MSRLNYFPFPKCGLPFWRFQYYWRYEEFRSNFGFIEIWKKFLISLVILSAQKRRTTFWKCHCMAMIRRFCGYCFQNHTCRLTTVCHKWIPRSKTTFKSSCSCHVSWDILYSTSTETETGLNHQILSKFLFSHGVTGFNPLIWHKKHLFILLQYIQGKTILESCPNILFTGLIKFFKI